MDDKLKKSIEEIEKTNAPYVLIWGDENRKPYGTFITTNQSMDTARNVMLTTAATIHKITDEH